MPHLQSLYPPIPDIDVPNYFDFVMGLEHFKSLPDYTVFIDGLTGERWRLRAFFARVDACATALASSEAEGGLDVLANPNEIVGIFSENSMEWPTLVYACLKLAVPFALLPAYSTAAEFRHLLKTSDATRLFASPSVLETALTVAREVGLPEHRVYVLKGRVVGRTSVADLVQNARSRGFPTAPSRRMHSDHVACLGFSSGTSGLPKAVMISHKNLYYSLMQNITIGQELAKVTTRAPPNTPEGVPMSIAFMPYYHVTAFHLSMMRIFTPPCTVIVLPRWKLDTVLDVLQKYDVTNFGLVPSMAHEFIHSPRFQTTDFSKVLSFTSGAAQLPLAHRKTILARMPHVQFAMAYGMTECVSGFDEPGEPTRAWARASNGVAWFGSNTPRANVRLRGFLSQYKTPPLGDVEGGFSRLRPVQFTPRSLAPCRFPAAARSRVKNPANAPCAAKITQAHCARHPIERGPCRV